MGNQPPSSPCFDDQVYTTLSWADAQGSCRNLCNATTNKRKEKDSSPIESVRKTPARPPKPEQRQDDISETLSSTLTPKYHDPLPALTDNLSSSDPEEEEDRNNPQHRFRSHARPRFNAAAPLGTEGNAIQLHNQPLSLSLSHSAEYYLGVGAASSNDHTNTTSGSLERDARVDLGTSRGSSGGREDVDEYYFDISEERLLHDHHQHGEERDE
mmetsp:Transcript_113852/g.318015  ORF Transcript_113852/g.318015 Transcript_113852/m.318015 type:complete len:213 (-) Transcript_113852:104-742(-)